MTIPEKTAANRRRRTQLKAFTISAAGLLILGAACGPSKPVAADDSGNYQVVNDPTRNQAVASPAGYQIGEDTATADTGPVRLARISYLNGPVTWRPTDSTDWSNATMNLPCRQGSEIWVKNGSRAELQFDDGSTLRLGGGAVASLHTMYSDDHGEFTEIKLTGGLGTLHMKNQHSIYQVDAPLCSVKANGPGEYRVGVGRTVEVACLSGNVDVDGQQGDTVLHSRDRLEVLDPSSPYQVTTVPQPDQWDRFNDNRDVVYNHRNRHVPVDIDLVAGDLDDYGTWHDDPNYGYVWAPVVHEVNWRPYHHGRWVWVSPWGWTWVGDEAWGYAPYHYGTWVHRPYGWAWCPGPAVQYWSPAVVDYVDDGDYVSWVPLAPEEVRYPSGISIGFRSGDWSLFFSIGGTAAYYPVSGGYCEPRPWNNRFVNREVNIYNVTNVTNYYNRNSGGFDRTFVRDSRFIPRNATRYAGMTSATRSAFLHGGTFSARAADPRGLAFHRGRSFASAPQHDWQVAGPPNLRPGKAGYTASRSFAKNGGAPHSALARSVVRRDVPAAIARHGNSTFKTLANRSRTAKVVRNLGTNRGSSLSATNRARSNMRVAPPKTTARAHGNTKVRGVPPRNLGHSGNGGVIKGRSHNPPIQTGGHSRSTGGGHRTAIPRTIPHAPVRSGPSRQIHQPTQHWHYGERGPSQNRQVHSSPPRQSRPPVRSAPPRQGGGNSHPPTHGRGGGGRKGHGG